MQLTELKHIMVKLKISWQINQKSEMKIITLKLNLFLIFLIAFSIVGKSQFKSRINLIVNDVKYKNGNLTVKYKIENAKEKDNIRVWIDVFNSKKDTIRAKSWTGDIAKFVEGGGEKVAVWSVYKDEMEIIDSLTVKVSAIIENRFYLDDPMILSTIYPGWGDYKINQKKPYWIYGALGYSLIGASVGMYYNSINSYDKYLSSNSIEDKNMYFDKALVNKNLTYAFIGAAGVVWAMDYLRIIKRKKEIKKLWNKNIPIKENPNIPSIKINSALSEKEFVNTGLTSLQLVQGTFKYVDKDENKCLDAFESGFIEFELFNFGPAKAVNFYAKSETTDSQDNSITFPDSVKIGTIAVNKGKVIRLPINASGDLKNGSVNVKVKVSAYQNNQVVPFEILINTCQYNYANEIPFNNNFSDVDRDIPFVSTQGKEKFALIIGNEGYSNKSTELSKNFNVPYARHDAFIFKKYAVNILGVKEANVILLLDATKKEMYESILTLSDQVSKAKDGAELVFYYAGHGLADTVTLAPYMVPIDIAPSNLKEAISLDFLYKKVWESRSTKSTIVMDASFNNGGRNMGLRGPSAKKINPRKEVISGNTVVFSAVSESYTANAYDEMKHGLFTYYFLKVLKESKGNIDYRRLDSSVKEFVSNRAISTGKQQVPIALVSVAVSDSWQNWSLR